jgi:beta-galactosidase
VRTQWNTPNIWLRRTFELKDAQLSEPSLMIHHDEDATVYINGELVATVAGFTTEYVTVPLNKKGRSALKAGQNTIAVHCKQTGGGQYIDVGIVDLVEQK